MEKVITIRSLKDKKTDFTYWQSKPETERLAAIETLRQQFINAKPQGIALVKWTAFNQKGEAVYTFTPIGIVPRRPAAT